jgi:crossover junction endodeoxyribonuclease RusA
MAATATLSLPWPPSVNRYWRSPNKGRLAGRTLLSAEARAYREAAAFAILRGEGTCVRTFTTRLAVSIVACPPDRRKRDLDNLLKPLLDALAHNLVIEDDSLIDDLRIRRGDIVADGRVFVTVTKAA